MHDLIIFLSHCFPEYSKSYNCLVKAIYFSQYLIGFLSASVNVVTGKVSPWPQLDN